MLTVSQLCDCDDITRSELSLATIADAPAGTSGLTFAADDPRPGLTVVADQVPAGTTVVAVAVAVTGTLVTLSQAVTTDLPAGTTVTFTTPTLGQLLSQRRGPVGGLPRQPGQPGT